MSKTELIAEPGKQDMFIKRVFDAPPEVVYKAFTDPNLLRQWLGPRGYIMTECSMDARPGGSWRYVHGEPGGESYGFHGVFHDAVPNKRILQTFEFEGWPGHVSLEEAVFEPQNGKTLITMHSVYQSVEDRDGMIASGMEGGMNEGFDKLDELLAERQKNRVS